MNPHIERAAQAIEDVGELDCTLMALAALSTTLEPSEAEIEAGAVAMYDGKLTFYDMWPDHRALYKQRSRACLIAAARVRVAE